MDYTAASGTLTFQAGESSRTIEVAVLDEDQPAEVRRAGRPGAV